VKPTDFEPANAPGTPTPTAPDTTPGFPGLTSSANDVPDASSNRQNPNGESANTSPRYTTPTGAGGPIGRAATAPARAEPPATVDDATNGTLELDVDDTGTVEETVGAVVEEATVVVDAIAVVDVVGPATVLEVVVEELGTVLETATVLEVVDPDVT
jgi:hypothetical protein